MSKICGWGNKYRIGVHGEKEIFKLACLEGAFIPDGD